MVLPISLEVRYWHLIQKHASFYLVVAILATDCPVSLLTALQIFAKGLDTVLMNTHALG